MSHLAHIVTVKQALIGQGVTDPVKQIEVVRTAYVRALFMVKNKLNIAVEHQGDFYRYVLAYWNEVHPVAGNLVIAEITHFNGQLTQAINNVASVDKIVIEIAPIEFEGSVVEIPGYVDLVNTMVKEAESKYKDFQSCYVE
ncbi:hypothetical protein [Aeromonas phage AerS_266]|nr:hypothetical protein [Aeromonas phage AerS_266]